MLLFLTNIEKIAENTFSILLIHSFFNNYKVWKILFTYLYSERKIV